MNLRAEPQLGNMREHTLRFFDDELNGLRASIVGMGRVAEDQVRQSTDVIVTYDTTLASTVINHNADFHQLKRSLEKEAIRIIALRQPLANDLRLTIAAIKMGAILERVGDFASNIAKRAVVLADGPANS